MTVPNSTTSSGQHNLRRSFQSHLGDTISYYEEMANGDGVSSYPHFLDQSYASSALLMTEPSKKQIT